MKLLESPDDIREALGPILDVIGEFSNLEDELLQTNRLLSNLAAKYPNYCASCGYYFSESLDDACLTHILCIEEGGATVEDNLVLLCEGCNKLYETGHASVQEMHYIASNWRNDCFISLRPEMDRRHEKELLPVFRPLKGRHFIRVGQYLKDQQYDQARKLIKTIQKQELSCEEQALSVMVEARIERKRPVRGSLEKSRALLANLDLSCLPKEWHPRYYYECGLIAKVSGFHEESIRHFKKSAEEASRLQDEYSGWEELIARHRQYVAETILMPYEKVSPDLLEARSDAFDQLAADVSKFDQPFSGRWLSNVLSWKWRYYHKCADRESAMEVYEEWNRVRYSTGYVRDPASSICAYEAMMQLGGMHSEEELYGVLRSVSRTLMVILTFPARPGNIRDFLLVFEKALSHIRRKSSHNYSKIAEQVTRIRESIVDGTSFLDPYRAS